MVCAGIIHFEDSTSFISPFLMINDVTVRKMNLRAEVVSWLYGATFQVYAEKLDI